MPSGRGVCPSCTGQTLTVFVAGRKTVCDWPAAEHGDVAVEHTVGDSWLARHVPVGEPVRLVEKRYRHECGDPLPDLSEPLDAIRRILKTISGL